MPVWLCRHEFLTVLRRRRILRRLRLICCGGWFWCSCWFGRLRPAVQRLRSLLAIVVLLLVIRPILLHIRRRLHRPARWLHSGRYRLWSLLTIVIAGGFGRSCWEFGGGCIPARWLDSREGTAGVRRFWWIWPILLPVLRRGHRPARRLHPVHRLRDLLLAIVGCCVGWDLPAGWGSPAGCRAVD